MKIKVQILDEAGKVVAEHVADACQPSAWTAPSGQPLIGSMPQNSSDVKNNGTYELFRITFQPTVRVNRPNGWQEPAPSPNTGLPANFPMGYSQKSSWGTSAPTPAANKSNMSRPGDFKR